MYVLSESGKLTVLNDANGDQVAYNGHLLYTFTSDHPGQVTGQGFQNFFVNLSILRLFCFIK